ncbi:MAG: hypothetical protein M3R17_05160 [Bacteroidota bacterium]|nr:hypothetical protein [Bacteroidota bacterium]
MKKYFLSFKSFILCAIFFLTAVQLSSQETSEKEYKHRWNEKVLNLGKNGIAVIGSDPFGKPAIDPHVLKFDSTANLAW